MDIGGVALDELRTRFASGGEKISDRLLAALRRDPRAGARALGKQLERRRRRDADERARLDALFAAETELASRGVARVAGVDEVGMGPLAGPVVAAAVVLRTGARLEGLRDSKQLRRAARERLDAEIRAAAVDVSIAAVEPADIDRINIYQAGLLAMRRAVEGLAAPPGQLLVDARRIPGVDVAQRPIVGGDATVASIAAASIVAKVWRDARMRALHRRYPRYGFASNAGYATAQHLRALEDAGPCPAHRRSFAPVERAR